MSVITIPDFSLVVLIGPSGCGKSTFAARHFRPTEVISSDLCRGLVSDDPNDQSATKDAFELVHYLAAKRLANRRLSVIDATNVQPEARRPLVALAHDYHCLLVAIVFDLPEELCQARNRARPDRDFGPHVVRQQARHLHRSLRGLEREGFRTVHILRSPEEVEAVQIARQPLWTDRRGDHGPFDIVGDVHGCFDELTVLLDRLGYRITTSNGDDGARYLVLPPEGRRLIFLGDLVDRGPKIPDTLRLAMDMVEAGSAFCLPGNHDMKLLRKLRGRDVQIGYGLAESLDQLTGEPPDFIARVMTFLDSLVSHYVLDDGNLVVAHGGMPAELQGRASRKVRDFALYGATTGQKDEYGLPVRLNWAADYRGRAMVVYGHTPVAELQWQNNTINIDTGCVFGGRLTALRYPERELVSVPALKTYQVSARPLSPAHQAPVSPARPADDLLSIEDVAGKRIIQTRLHRSITITEEQAGAALETMSRFAVDPHWLVYLPPTMSPSETSPLPGWLEHPAEVFAYYRHQGVPQVVCEEKHMGSRAVVVLGRDATVATQRFGVTDGSAGICYTRTGRRFFEDPAMETELLARLRAALEATGFWERFETGWAVFDCELMPWSVKAQELLRQQYAPVGAAARGALPEAVQALERAAAQGIEGSQQLLDGYRERLELTERFAAAYRHYCWPVESIADLKLAPFHLLATEGAVHVDRDHVWHMETIHAACQADPNLLLATAYQVVDVTDPASQQAAIDWWEELTARGGEGMVVKPMSFVAKGRHGLVQPAIKCRGPEYLRIIYGPEYSLPQHLERLRARGLSAKRSLALREFALGIEALERFTRGEPLYRVHECVFGVLALESEPVDPRL